MMVTKRPKAYLYLLSTKNSTTLTVESLPQKYSHIVEFDLPGKVNIHIPLDCAVDIKLFDDRVNDLDLKEEREWLIQAAGYVFHEDSTEANHWAQRCRSVFNIGGYNSAFLPFFRDFEILGGIFRFCRFFKF